jgi:hypothetical protein
MVVRAERKRPGACAAIGLRRDPESGSPWHFPTATRPVKRSGPARYHLPDRRRADRCDRDRHRPGRPAGPGDGTTKGTRDTKPGRVIGRGRQPGRGPGRCAGAAGRVTHSREGERIDDHRATRIAGLGFITKGRNEEAPTANSRDRRLGLHHERTKTRKGDVPVARRRGRPGQLVFPSSFVLSSFRDKYPASEGGVWGRAFGVGGGGLCRGKAPGTIPEPVEPFPSLEPGM